MNRLSRIAALPLAPVLFPQAVYMRRTIPRLADAALPWHGTVPGSDPIRLLVLGDSTSAGVGAAVQDEALPGNIGRELRHRFGRGTTWRAVGKNGATSRDLLDQYLPEATAEPVDLAFITIGANDALGVRSRRAFTRDLIAVVEAMQAASPRAIILVSLMPRFDRFPSLVQPLRWSLALHAASLDDAARAALAGRENLFTLPTPPPYTANFWASDGFHPSANGYRQWIDFVFDSVPEQILAGLAR